MKTFGLICAFLLVIDVAAIHGQKPRRAVSDAQIVIQGQRVGSGTSVEIYQHGVTVDPAFLQLMESVYKQVETVTGAKLDTAALGPKVHVYVSDAVSVSHVWRGYQHASDPKAIIFLNPRVYVDAMSGTNATHIHELTHLFTWRFTSHTLREGLADHVALVLLPGAAVGPNPGGVERPPDIPAEILAYIGTTKPPPEWLATDRERRRAYYFASRRFVSALVEMKGMETFMKLYGSENPESAIRSLYGISREEALQAALKGKPE